MKQRREFRVHISAARRQYRYFDGRRYRAVAIVSTAADALGYVHEYRGEGYLARKTKVHNGYIIWLRNRSGSDRMKV